MSIKIEISITADNLPEDLLIDQEGGIYKAEACDHTVFGCEWRWVAKNIIALGNGKPVGDMIPVSIAMFQAQKRGSND
jgi:hypothetical protein